MDKNIVWVVDTSILLIWTVGSLLFWARLTAARKGDDLVALLSCALPPYTLVTLLLFFLITPRESPVSAVFMWLHHLSFLGLLGFLSLAQYAQIRAYFQVKQKDFEGARSSFHFLYYVTLLAPAPIALTVLLTGMRLIYQKPPDVPQLPGQDISLSALWLQAVLISFSIFFWDGVLGYTPAVKEIYRRTRFSELQTWDQAQSISETWLFGLHFLSWFAVLIIAVMHPMVRSPLSPSIDITESFFGSLLSKFGLRSPVWTELLTAIVLFSGTGACIYISRAIGSRLKQVSGNGIKRCDVDLATTQALQSPPANAETEAVRSSL